MLALSMTACSEHYNVAVLDAGEGRRVTILAERFYENEQATYYKVDVGGNTVVPLTYLSSIDPEDVERLRLRLVTSKDGSLVGVVEEKLPQKIWMLHNFNTGGTWPRCETGGLERCEERGQALLKDLQKDHPGVVF